MKKRLLKLLRNIVVSSFLLYGYNLIAAPFYLMIPINIITVLSIAVLGIPMLFSFIVILIFGF